MRGKIYGLLIFQSTILQDNFNRSNQKQKLAAESLHIGKLRILFIVNALKG
jgi:hypothetical protein